MLTEYPGNYTDYVEEKARRARGEIAYVADNDEDEEYETKTRAMKKARGK